MPAPYWLIGIILVVVAGIALARYRRRRETRIDVYTDADAAGNHFPAQGQFGDPTSPTIPVDAAEAITEQGARAKQVAQNALFDAQRRVDEAMEAARAGDWSHAQLALDSALRLHPHSSEIVDLKRKITYESVIHHAVALIQAGDIERAERSLSEVLSTAPDDRAGHLIEECRRYRDRELLLHARSLIETGRISEAEKLLSRLLSAFPADDSLRSLAYDLMKACENIRFEQKKSYTEAQSKREARLGNEAERERRLRRERLEREHANVERGSEHEPSYSSEQSYVDDRNRSLFIKAIERWFNADLKGADDLLRRLERRENVRSSTMQSIGI